MNVTPPDFTKAPFSELRQLIPIRLTTDAWSVHGNGMEAEYEYMGPPTPPEGQQDSSLHFSDYRDSVVR